MENFGDSQNPLGGGREGHGDVELKAKSPLPGFYGLFSCGSLWHCVAFVHTHVTLIGSE